MNWFNNLKTRTKFFVSVFTVIVGLLFVIMYGINIINSNSKTFVGLIEKDQGLVLALSEIYAQGLQSEQATRNVLLNPNDQKAKDNYKKADSDFDKQLNLAKQSAGDNNGVIEKLNAIEQKWQEIDELKKKVQEAAVSGSSQEAVAMLTTIETPQWRGLKDNVLTLIKTIKAEIDVKKKEAIDSASHAFRNMITYALVIVIISLIILFFVANTFVKPIKLLEESANKVASGDTDVAVAINSTDELGNLAKSFNVMVGNIRTYLTEAKQKGAIAEAAAMEAEKAKTIANEQKEYLDINVKKILAEMEKFSNGNLDVHLVSEKDDEIGKLFNGFNRSVLNISEMISEVKTAIDAAASASSEISSSSEQMAAGAHEQSQQAAEVAGAIEEMTKTVFETAKNANKAAEMANESNQFAVQGEQKVEETKQGIQRIVHSAKETAEVIASLAGRTDQIGEIAQVIDDIADQTNLLALNAAIEAARAGEQGRGFAVVADEVRKLAERTTKATKEIAETIKAIQMEARQADNSMVEANQSVEEGMRLTMEVSEMLSQITAGSHQGANVIRQMARSMEEQSSAAEQISKNIEGISSVTQQSAAGTQQIAHAAEDLNRLTVNLQDLISGFRLAEEHLRVKNGRMLQN